MYAAGMSGSSFDIALDRTLGAVSLQARLTGLAQLAEHLLGIPAPAAIALTTDESSLHIPPPLRWFHGLNARFCGPSAQNPFVPLANLEGGPRMVFASE